MFVVPLSNVKCQFEHVIMGSASSIEVLKLLSTWVNDRAMVLSFSTETVGIMFFNRAIMACLLCMEELSGLSEPGIDLKPDQT